jgi:hypothetical protein
MVITNYHLLITDYRPLSMDLGSLLLGLALLILVAAYIARPLFEREAAKPLAAALDSALLAERDNVLTALRDLDFDHSTGKIAAEDYQAQRAALVSRGAAILQQLDAGAGPAEDLEAQIEAAIAARRQRDGAQPRSDLEVAAPAARVESLETPTHFCPNCGTPALEGDKFCARCGKRLTPPAPARQARA